MSDTARARRTGLMQNNASTAMAAANSKTGTLRNGISVNRNPAGCPNAMPQNSVVADAVFSLYHRCREESRGIMESISVQRHILIYHFISKLRMAPGYQSPDAKTVLAYRISVFPRVTLCCCGTRDSTTLVTCDAQRTDGAYRCFARHAITFLFGKASRYVGIIIGQHFV